MRELDMFVSMVVKANRDGVSVGILKAQLIQDGMSMEEVSILLDIVALEVRHTPTPEYPDMRVITSKRATLRVG